MRRVLLGTVVLLAGVVAAASLLSYGSASSDGSAATLRISIVNPSAGFPDPDDPYHLDPNLFPEQLQEVWFAELAPDGSARRLHVLQFDTEGALIQEGLAAGDGSIANAHHLLRTTTVMDYTPFQLLRNDSRLRGYEIADGLALSSGALTSDLWIRELGPSPIVDVPGTYAHIRGTSDEFPGLDTYDADVVLRDGLEPLILRSMTVEEYGVTAEQHSFVFSVPPPNYRVIVSSAGEGVVDQHAEWKEVADPAPGTLVVAAGGWSTTHYEGVVPIESIGGPTSFTWATAVAGTDVSIAEGSGWMVTLASGGPDFRDALSLMVAQWERAEHVEMHAGDLGTRTGWRMGEPGDEWAIFDSDERTVVIRTEGAVTLDDALAAIVEVR